MKSFFLSLQPKTHLIKLSVLTFSPLTGGCSEEGLIIDAFRFFFENSRRIIQYTVVVTDAYIISNPRGRRWISHPISNIQDNMARGAAAENTV